MKRKKITALALAATMMMSGTVVAFAEDSTGSGSFEGVEPELPAVGTITLPTSQEATGIYSYIADPAGLIRKYAKDEATKSKLPAENADKGIYFTKKDGKYSSDSEKLKVTNHNARNIDVTVKAEVVSENYDDLTFSTTGTWTEADKDNEIYLAVLESNTPTNISAIKADAAAEITIPIEGKPTNYEVVRTVTNDKATYEYQEKEPGAGEAPLSWNEAEFNLTGAINKYADWKDGNVKVPNIKVTWTAKAHVASVPALATGSTTANYEVGAETDLVLTTTNVTAVTAVKLGDTTVASSNYSFDAATNKLTVKAAALAGVTEAGSEDLKITVNNAEVTGAELTCAITFIADAAPSITDSDNEYSLVADTAIEIGLSLGRGEDAAESIASISFVGSSGNASVVANDSYSYGDGKLTLTAAFVNALMNTNAYKNASEFSRTYTIKFDNNKTVTFILKK